MNPESNPSAAASRPSHSSVTRELARYAAQSRYSDLPDNVKVEASRAFLNWMGCALGGCLEPAVTIAAAMVAELGGQSQASVIGHDQRTDVASAAFVNCISSSVQAFDDAHLATVTHPSGPVGAALLAYSENHATSGEDFLHAFALGIEVQCRLSNMLVLQPSNLNVGFYVTGLTGPIGVAVAVGNLLRLDEQRMNWAIGLAASQASGFRATHGTMTAHFRPGHAARCGVWAAMLAERGFTGDDQALEADKGFIDVYSSNADPSHALDGLGQHFELLSNNYKPYPCGIVIHASLDACLDVYRRAGADAAPVTCTLHVHPLALKLTGVRTPRTPLESHVSLYHWAAASLVNGAAGIAEMRQECIDNPEVASLRQRIEAIGDAALDRDEAIVEVNFADGRTLRSHVKNVGARRMTDDELDAKFYAQAILVLPQGNAARLKTLCRNLASLKDVGREIPAAWQRSKQ
ncbi:MmgE/PrpD family protein [Variovorax saccharolyticus]|uniref:MmgE/PrpD family protein n=1 Tax=Variovorax saccharolyticus TaxID=3053516 RepID=UPI0025774AD1|nr:MmgE/PrpD family protein [Variovorax sp. J22R187]MDM0022237.1 MmgE/PrpD family protein [Variovorax sp. J22R187]